MYIILMFFQRCGELEFRHGRYGSSGRDALICLVG